MMNRPDHPTRRGRFRAVTAAVGVALALLAAGCSSGSKSASSSTTKPAHHASSHVKAQDTGQLTTGGTDTSGLGSDPGGQGGDSGSLSSDGSNGQANTAVANDAQLATPTGYSVSTTDSTPQQQAFVKADDNSEIWWPGCTYDGTTDTAGSATQCLNHFGQMAKTGDPTSGTFGGVPGTLLEGETAQSAGSPVPLLVGVVCLPTYGQHVACAVLATPASSGSIPAAEASAFIDAINGLSSYSGKS